MGGVYDLDGDSRCSACDRTTRERTHSEASPRQCLWWSLCSVGDHSAHSLHRRIVLKNGRATARKRAQIIFLNAGFSAREGGYGDD